MSSHDIRGAIVGTGRFASTAADAFGPGTIPLTGYMDIDPGQGRKFASSAETSGATRTETLRGLAELGCNFYLVAVPATAVANVIRAIRYRSEIWPLVFMVAAECDPHQLGELERLRDGHTVELVFWRELPNAIWASALAADPAPSYRQVGRVLSVDVHHNPALRQPELHRLLAYALSLLPGTPCDSRLDELTFEVALTLPHAPWGATLTLTPHRGLKTFGIDVTSDDRMVVIEHKSRPDGTQWLDVAQLYRLEVLGSATAPGRSDTAWLTRDTRRRILSQSADLLHAMGEHPLLVNRYRDPVTLPGVADELAVATLMRERDELVNRAHAEQQP